jgi:hypothetical protein
MQGSTVEAGFTVLASEVMHTITYSGRFESAPILFAGIISAMDTEYTSIPRGHLRLLEAGDLGATIATEYDSCDFSVRGGDHIVSWIALENSGAHMEITAKITQRRTSPSDKVALLAIAGALGLPEYLLWQNSSDPCSDRWAGIECRAGKDDTARVVVLDIHNMDLTGKDIPWLEISQLSQLEELSVSCTPISNE